MIKDVEHFFRGFSAIWYFSVENSLFSSVLYFLIGLFDFLESSLLRLCQCLENAEVDAHGPLLDGTQVP